MKRLCFLILTCCIVLTSTKGNNGSKKDSLNGKPFLLFHVYPSSVVFGNLSLGAEFGYKRIRQEVVYFYKTFKLFDWDIYDLGFEWDYFFKYDFVKRKKHRVSFDVGYMYLKRSYSNAIFDKTVRMSYNQGVIEPSLYKEDGETVCYGPGFGISNLSKLYKNFYWGANLTLFIYTNKTDYTIKEYVSGPPVQSVREGSTLPYHSAYVQKHAQYLDILIKIGYRLK